MSLDITKLFDKKLDITSDGVLYIYLSKVKLYQYKNLKDEMAMNVLKMPEVAEKLNFEDGTDGKLNADEIVLKLFQDPGAIKKILVEQQGDYTSLIEGGEAKVKKHYEEVIKEKHSECSYEDYKMLINAEIISEMENEIKGTPTNS